MGRVIGGHAPTVHGAKAAKRVVFLMGFWVALFAIVLAAGRVGAQANPLAASADLDTPSDFCVGRFLTPLDAMAGVVPAAGPSSTPWLERVAAAGRALA